MAQIRKVEGQIELKTNGVKFFNVWAHTLHQNYKTMCPNKLAKVELLGGTRHLVGSLIAWHYLIDGNCEVNTTKTQARDDEDLSVTYETIDGKIIKQFYTSFKLRNQVIPKGSTSILKLSYEYEKRNDDAPDADIFVEFVLSLAKDVDTRLSKV